LHFCARSIPRPVALAVSLLISGSSSITAAAPLDLTGVTGAHDPSTLEQYATNGYIYFCTGQDIVSRTSSNMTHWNNGPAVFSTIPAWTTEAVPGFTGDFWAPEVSYFDGIYHLYYAVSTFGSQVSAIGMATNTTLNPSSPNYDWVDQGEVIGSTNGSAYNTIDPSILVQPDGTVWMTFGSYWNGIYETQLNPITGKLLNTTTTQVADNSQIEASYLYAHGGYYYLFVNFGMCCDGVDSTYNIRVGRSTSVTGPFYDQNGVPMTQGGGTLLLGTDGRYIGPGQTGIFLSTSGQYWLSDHYYDGDNNGTPTYELQQLYWTGSGWPSVTVVPEPSAIAALLFAGPLLLRRRKAPLLRPASSARSAAETASL
jgi:arabinan endo-1,5-alpha-L-arabinosidase